MCWEGTPSVWGNACFAGLVMMHMCSLHFLMSPHCLFREKKEDLSECVVQCMGVFI